MIGDGQAAAALALQRNPLFLKQALDVGGVMNDLVIPAELRKLVAQLVEAVRAARDDRFHLVPIERADRVLGQHLIEVLVAHPARRVAVTVLLLPQDREVDVAGLEDSRKCDGDLLGSVVERSHTSNPEQDVRALAARHDLGHRVDLQSVRPLRPVRRD